jgi:transcriptional regulator with XRE-family HTH domain
VHSFPKNLKRLRLINGLTKRKLASLIGVSESQLYKWEKGIYIPNSENMISLAKIFGVTMRVLMEDADTKTISGPTMVAHSDVNYEVGRTNDPELIRLHSIAEYLEHRLQDVYADINARLEVMALENKANG